MQVRAISENIEINSGKFRKVEWVITQKLSS